MKTTLTVYKPEYRDLWFRRQMLEDEATMAYNRAWGGTIPFPEEKWADWYDFWLVNTEDKHWYRYVTDENGRFIGEIAYHFDAELGAFTVSVIIFAEYRGRGYGGQALELLLAAAKKNGLDCIYDDIAIDNPAADMFIRHGFAEEYRTAEKIYLKKRL